MKGAEAAEPVYLQVSRTPRPCSTPRLPERRGPAVPRTPGSRWADTASGVRVGVGTSRVFPGADAARRAQIAPPAPRVGLERLRRGSKGRLGSACCSPGYCLLPGGLAVGYEELRVSAELSGFLRPSQSVVGIAREVERERTW